MKGLKVANSAQTTAALGVSYEFMPKTFFTVDYNYFGNLYADFDPSDRELKEDVDINEDAVQAWKVPDFATFDASVRYSFNMGSFDTTIAARMYNILNTQYIADAQDGSSHTASDALVWYGYGRTFNLSAKLRF